MLSWSCETAASEAARHILLFLLSWFEDLSREVKRQLGLTAVLNTGAGTNLEGAQQALVDTHHGSSIVEFTAVVGRAE